MAEKFSILYDTDLKHGFVKHGLEKHRLIFNLLNSYFFFVRLSFLNLRFQEIGLFLFFSFLLFFFLES